MVESRGKGENMRLERAYRYVYNNGSDYLAAKLFQKHLSSKEIKLEPKTANVSGLQMADMIANPSTRSLICCKTKVEMTADFGKQIVDTLTRVSTSRIQQPGKSKDGARSGCPKKITGP